MGNGYTRNDTANNIADGNVINASDLDGEFDAIQSAFHGSTGHSHDGTSGEGPQIGTGGIANNAVTLGTKTSGNYVAAGAVSGVGLSGSASAEGATFTVTSNATNANTASTIVARDASGNFSAGTITASLSGTASNAALLDNIDSSSFLRSDAADTKTSGNLSFSDNVKAQFGAGSDLQIFHDGSHSRIYDNGGGELKIMSNGTAVRIQKDNGENMILANTDGAVNIYHDGSAKLATTATGVDVTGTVTADGITSSQDINITESIPQLNLIDTDGTNVQGSLVQAGGNLLIRSRNGTSTFGSFIFARNNGADTNVFRTFSNGDFSLLADDGTTEALRFDASTQRLGLGTTTPVATLEVDGTTTLTGGGTGSIHVNVEDSSLCPTMTFTRNGGGTIANGFLKFENSGGQVAEVNAAGGGYFLGNVGIGVSSVTNKLVLPNAAYFAWKNNAGSSETIAIRGNTSDGLEFLTGTTRMTITSGGHLLVGKTSQDSTNTVGFEAKNTGEVIATVDGAPTAFFNRKTSDGDVVAFRKNNTTVGSIGVEFSDNLFVGGNSSHVAVGFGTSGVYPSNGDGTPRDNEVSLGDSANRFKDLYLSGGVTVNGGTITAGASGTSGQINAPESFVINIDSDNNSTNRAFVIKNNGSAEIARFTESGRLGLGTTTPSVDLDLTSSRPQISFGNTTSSQETAVGYDSDNTSFYVRNIHAGNVDFWTNNVRRMRINSSGNVGIGTSSPDRRLQVRSDENDQFNCTIGLAPSTVDTVQGGLGVKSGGIMGFNAVNTITFGIGGADGDGASEVARIDTGGNLLVGTTSADPIGANTGNGRLAVGPTANESALNYFNATGGACLKLGVQQNTSIVRFFRNTASVVQVGDISVTTTSTSYTTTSDIRLKTDIAPIADATDKLMAMNPVSHKWKAEPDADAVVGFIAQEMQEIVPEAVSKGDSEDDMWSMDYGRITPVLVAALQDAHKKIEQLEQRIADMETK